MNFSPMNQAAVKPKTSKMQHKIIAELFPTAPEAKGRLNLTG